MTVDVLQRLLRTLNDATRIRILALLEREELAVHELVRLLGVAQSTVSRHLSILREAQLVRERREGNTSFSRFEPPAHGPWQAAWQLAREATRDDPVVADDLQRLEILLEERALQSRAWFDAVGPEWDRLRRVFHDDVQRARAIGRLVPSDMVVADIGTGTGILADELARSGVRVIAVDQSERMLETAARKLAERGVTGVDFRRGEATALPLDDGEADAAIAHMVLHYVASPAEAIREMARVVRPGGRVVIVDFAQPEDGPPVERDWLRKDLGLLWHGFTRSRMSAWLAAAGLDQIAIEERAPAPGSRDIPSTFIASATRGVAGTSGADEVASRRSRTTLRDVVESVDSNGPGDASLDPRGRPQPADTFRPRV